MARCGCQGAAATTCEAIMRCVGSNLGPGLGFDPETGRLRVRLSRDAGNIASFGTDQGLYVPSDGTPPPDTGRKTVDGLEPVWFAGIDGGSALVKPHASPQGLEYAISTGLEVVEVGINPSRDDVAYCRVNANPDSGVWNRVLHTGGPTPQWHQLQWSQMSGFMVDAGSPGVSPTGRFSDAPSRFLTPDGGWYGFFEPHYRLYSLQRYLQEAAARIVVMAELASPGFESQEPGYMARTANAMVDAILAEQAQQWLIVLLPVAGMALASVFLDAGINHVGIAVNQNHAVTPAQVSATGAEFVSLVSPNRINAEGTTWERFEEFAATDLKIMGVGSNRQEDVRQLVDAEVDGIRVIDAVYARGARGRPSDLSYKSSSTTFQVTRSRAPGMLTYRTDDSYGGNRQGYCIASDQGWRYGDGYTTGRIWNPDTESFDPSRRHHMSHLLGELCPVTNPNQFSVQVRCRANPDTTGTTPAGNRPKVGILVGSPWDLDPSAPQDTFAGTNARGYLCFVRVGTTNNGDMEILKFDEDGDFERLDLGSGPSVAPGQTVEMRVDVSPTVISFSRIVGGQDVATLTVQDSDWRGPYVYFTWDEPNAPNASGVSLDLAEIPGNV